MPKIPEKKKARVYWDGHGVQLWLGHVLDALALMPERSVHMCVTSPPYWGLRDYGTGTWHGGDPNCDHTPNGRPEADRPKGRLEGGTDSVDAGNKAFRDTCGKCGARRVDHQLGSEPSPDCGTQGKAQCGRCFVCNMVAVFRAVRRVLRDDGTLWLNLGDTYSGGGNTAGRNDADPVGVDGFAGSKGKYGSSAIKKNTNGLGASTQGGGRINNDRSTMAAGRSGLPSGNLVGAPWRVALALQDDGWVLRSDIPWVKRSPMPESANNRPNKALEYVFLFTKSMKYFFDMQAVRKQAARPGDVQTFGKRSKVAGDYDPNDPMFRNGSEQAGRTVQTGENGRNFRNADLWFESVDAPYGLTGIGDEMVGIDVTSQGYPGAHYAVFPGKLIEPMILAGTSARGCCAACGAPWVREVAKGDNVRAEEGDRGSRDRSIKSNRNGITGSLDGKPALVQTTGWRPGCECNGRIIRERVKTLGYGSYHSHEMDGIGYGLRQDGGPASVPGPKTKEMYKIVETYESDLPVENHPMVPAVVLDPFMGSGTTGAVCIALGRRAVGIDLSEKYLRENAVPRIKRAELELPGAQAATGLKSGRVVLGGKK